MPVGDRRASIVRRIDGLERQVEFLSRSPSAPATARCCRGCAACDEEDGTEVIVAVAGPDALVLRGDELPDAVGP